MEEHGLINESQAGFRRNYSTIDHIFTLLALVQRQVLNHGKLYVAFIDVKKAFDLVDRSCLWAVLRKNSVRGFFLQSYTKYVWCCQNKSSRPYAGFYVSSWSKAGRYMQPDFVFSLHQRTCYWNYTEWQTWDYFVTWINSNTYHVFCWWCGSPVTHCYWSSAATEHFEGYCWVLL